ncbi:hypothetical protein PISL3812_09914 [Talaromyces islandicus]|uniref:Uncharacterized protein n=1 Tax=Talaromyces islandicus TaxID=28573 RepID=A0A0U1MB51_TALIS|nr:hypothetical protein PISL3812_09914 [Talaromyces islandicus]
MDKKSAETRPSRTLKIPKETKAVRRDDPNLELLDGELSDTDPRRMSPRRDEKSTERLSGEAAKTLEEERKSAEQTFSRLREEISELESGIKQQEENNEWVTQEINKLSKK